MSSRNLLDLIKQFEQITRQIVGLERDLAEVQRRILDVSREPQPRKRRARHALAGPSDVVQELVRVLRDAKGPLPRKEIAARLKLTPWGAAYRLRSALGLRLVEKAGMGRYRLADVVSADGQ